MSGGEGPTNGRQKADVKNDDTYDDIYTYVSTSIILYVFVFYICLDPNPPAQRAPGGVILPARKSPGRAASSSAEVASLLSWIQSWSRASSSSDGARPKVKMRPAPGWISSSSSLSPASSQIRGHDRCQGSARAKNYDCVKL